MFKTEHDVFGKDELERSHLYYDLPDDASSPSSGVRIQDRPTVHQGLL